MKKLIRTKIPYETGWEYNDVSIAQIKQQLTDLEKMGVTHLDFDADHGLTVKCVSIREETDEEYVARTSNYENEIKERELAELKRLQAKYPMMS